MAGFAPPACRLFGKTQEGERLTLCDELEIHLTAVTATRRYLARSSRMELQRFSIQLNPVTPFLALMLKRSRE